MPPTPTSLGVGARGGSAPLLLPGQLSGSLESCSTVEGSAVRGTGLPSASGAGAGSQDPEEEARRLDQEAEALEGLEDSSPEEKRAPGGPVGKQEPPPGPPSQSRWGAGGPARREGQTPAPQESGSGQARPLGG